MRLRGAELMTESLFTVAVPDNAAGGAQYMLIVFHLVGNTADTGNWAVQSSLGVQVYSNIDGDTDVSARLVEQHIPIFSFEPQIQTLQNVENTGNVDIEATTTLAIRGFFGDEELYENTQTYLVHPETSRLVPQGWDGAPALGLFRVSSTVSLLGTDHV